MWVSWSAFFLTNVSDWKRIEKTKGLSEALLKYYFANRVLRLADSVLGRVVNTQYNARSTHLCSKTDLACTVHDRCK